MISPDTNLCSLDDDNNVYDDDDDDKNVIYDNNNVFNDNVDNDPYIDDDDNNNDNGDNNINVNDNDNVNKSKYYFWFGMVCFLKSYELMHSIIIKTNNINKPSMVEENCVLSNEKSNYFLLLFPSHFPSPLVHTFFQNFSVFWGNFSNRCPGFFYLSQSPHL